MTRRGMCSAASAPPEHGLRAPFALCSSVIHSHTLPVMSTRPNPLGGNVPTGEVPT
jgi:hypothetical protein